LKIGEAMGVEDLYDEFKRVYPLVDISLHFVEFAIIADYYSRKEIPLCGKVQWMQIDYARYCQYGECRPVTLFYDKIRYEKKSMTTTHRESTKSRVKDPSWTGPNGTWTLD
jgi:hypothetical protein